MHNHTKTLVFSFFLYLPCLMFGQYQNQKDLENYDISSYLRPDLQRQTLSPSGFFGGSGSYGPSRFGFVNSFPFRAQLDLFHSYFRNNARTQKFLSHGLGFDYSTNFEEEDSDIINMVYSANFVNRIFLDNSIFFSFASDVFLGFSERPDFTGFYDSQNIRISIPLRFGKGRVENVTDAWNAVVIMKNLEQQELLLKKISQDEIFNFAQKIGDIKNARFFDFRYQNIFELNQLSKHLTGAGMVNESIEFFSTLNDSWVYESFRQRSAGVSYGVGLRTDIKIDKESYQEKGYAMYAELFYENYNPVNQRLQFDQVYSVALGTGNARNSFIQRFLRGLDENYGFEAKANFLIGNYISARSYIEFSVDNSIFTYLTERQFDYQGAANFIFSKWISTRLRWTSRASVQYRDSRTIFSPDDNVFFYPSFSTNFTYFIF